MSLNTHTDTYCTNFSRGTQVFRVRPCHPLPAPVLLLDPEKWL